jgi:hypothetical protein
LLAQPGGIDAGLAVCGEEVGLILELPQQRLQVRPLPAACGLPGRSAEQCGNLPVGPRLVDYRNMAGSDSSREGQEEQRARTEVKAAPSESRGMSSSAREARVTAPETQREQPASAYDPPSPTDGKTAPGSKISAYESGETSEISGPEARVDVGDPARKGVSRGNQALQPSSEKVRDEAKTAGINAVKGMWEQAPKLLPLLGVFFYGLGRFAVDGFYARLNTTADAAGIGYLSTIEPAAILAAVLAIVGTAIVIVFDVFKVFFLWIVKHRSKFEVLLSLLGFLVSIAILITGIFHFNLNSTLWNVAPLAIGILTPAIYSLRVLINLFRSPNTAWPRLLSVGFSLIFLIALCFGAHELGVHEAGKVARGQAVDISVLGLDMSAINATPVHIQAVGSGSVIKQVSGDGCLIEIGSQPFTILLYDPASQATVTVPSSDVVVINSSASCRK